MDELKAPLYVTKVDPYDSQPLNSIRPSLWIWVLCCFVDFGYMLQLSSTFNLTSCWVIHSIYLCVCVCAHA